ncbi:hypothetical protein COY23_03595 [bacterium (Candidatus Torokbacteria) CG_4_10_14_0_2_um_filter_35_8]|uniref:Response regulatory domain-containing protein n=1 Tax=Candidatus Kerfeldbacteria bacterium CG_4_10_14_0_8_um_filter_42_10 TaxID=2014248 RepID=A0A2M7RG57_9BACT|nr:MAG: hypothetical protein COY66_06395 [Candidatus Kerfeldbacteria bacterium CG_4_10_14_0_8_um_filter_42_10]PIZ56097.1 MAG: hypothetical protein COY23_03595 [bacterium (Candidatus Torokbacteria) CG_4_10_14_0_2_um_filter_35_8]
MDEKKSAPAILVVDDEDEIRSLMERYVEGFFAGKGKFLCRTAKDGSTTLECIEERNFELIFMDVHFPGGNGIEFIKLIRKKEEANGFKPARIICITGLVTQEEGIRAIAAGADKCLFKPFDWKEIPKELEELFS